MKSTFFVLACLAFTGLSAQVQQHSPKFLSESESTSEIPSGGVIGQKMWEHIKMEQSEVAQASRLSLPAVKAANGSPASLSSLNFGLGDKLVQLKNIKASGPAAPVEEGEMHM